MYGLREGQSQKKHWGDPPVDHMCIYLYIYLTSLSLSLSLYVLYIFDSGKLWECAVS